MAEESQTNKSNSTPEPLSTSPARSDVLNETFAQKDNSRSDNNSSKED